MTAAANPAVSTAARPPTRVGRRLPITWLGVVPFFAYIAVFLLLPTVIIAAGSFATKSGNFTVSNFVDINQAYLVKAFAYSTIIAGVSAVVGALAGALVAYAVVTGNPRGILRRSITSASGVLAQFGGVTLAFAFLATVGPAGFMSELLLQRGNRFLADSTFLYELPGLILVYMYFQIPLMVIVFLPALDGVRPQWREATESLGGSTWHYWRYVAGPLLAPSFLGCALLLFANAFSAYATAQALVSQGSIIVPLAISNLLTSETGRAQPGLAQALALSMIIIVAIVTVLYSLLQRRTSRWLR